MITGGFDQFSKQATIIDKNLDFVLNLNPMLFNHMAHSMAILKITSEHAEGPNNNLKCFVISGNFEKDWNRKTSACEFYDFND